MMHKNWYTRSFPTKPLFNISSGKLSIYYICNFKKNLFFIRPSSETKKCPACELQSKILPITFLLPGETQETSPNMVHSKGTNILHLWKQNIIPSKLLTWWQSLSLDACSACLIHCVFALQLTASDHPPSHSLQLGLPGARHTMKLLGAGFNRTTCSVSPLYNQ